MPGARAGTQIERTQLSWSRTALAALALAAVAFKAGIGHRDVADIVSGSLATLAAAAIYACGRARAAREPAASLSSVRLAAALVFPAVVSAAVAAVLGIG